MSLARSGDYSTRVSKTLKGRWCWCAEGGLMPRFRAGECVLYNLLARAHKARWLLRFEEAEVTQTLHGEGEDE
eukprot:1194714-Prorocentrum_minimum.AAC.5